MKKVIIALISALLLIVPSTPALALSAALNPTFDTAVPTAGGFTAFINNYDAAYAWTAIGGNCTNAVVDSGGFLVVTGAKPNTSISVQVKTTRSGYTTGTATITATSAGWQDAKSITTPGSYANTINQVVMPDSTIYMLNNDGGAGLISKSVDSGKSWTTVNRLSGAIGGVLAVRGQTMAVVSRSGFGSNATISVQVSNNLGTTWGSSIQLEPAGNNNGPSIGISGDGDIFATWYKYDGSIFKVLMRNSTDHGATWSPAQAVSPATDSYYYTNVIQQGNGNLVVSMESYTGMSLMTYTDSTNTWGAVTANENSSSYNLGSANLVTKGNAEIMAVWFEGSGSTMDVKMSTYSAGAWSSISTVSSVQGNYRNLKLAVGTSSAVAVWSNGSNYQDIYLSKTALSTISWTARATVKTGSIEMISLTYLTSQKYALSWYEGTSYPVGGVSGSILRSMQTSDDGVSWTTQDSFAGPNNANYQPVLFSNGTGALIALWRIQTPASSTEVRASVFGASVTADAAKEVYLAAEINAGATHSHIYSPKVYNNKIYFSSTTPETGRELFVYDGTSVSLVQDFIPGAGSGLYDSNSVVGVYNNKLLLVADNGSTGWELYTFDGTTISLVLDANPGTGFGRPSNFIEYQSKLYFQTYIDATTTTYGWVWNYVNPPQLLGTAYSGYVRTGFAEPKILNGVLYFRSGLTGQMAKLTSFDGTTFSEVTTTGTLPTQMSVFGNKLLYSATTANEGFEPWYFDGTSEYFIGDLNPGSVDSNSAGFTAACSGVFFQAATTSTGRELYYWNGLSTPTLVSDIQAGASDGWPQSLFATENGILFGANDGTNGTELWFSDGATTSMVANTNPGSASFQPNSMVKFGNTVYMVGNTSATGIELYAYGVKPAGFASAAYVHSYTITYDANTGNGSASSTAGAGSVNLNSGSGFSKSGMTLLGWDTNASATSPTYTVGGSYTLSANVTLYAIWGAAAAPQTPSVPATPTVPLPSPADLQKQIGTIETAGGTITIEGAGLGTTREAYAGDKRAVISNISGDKLTLAMPKQPAGYYDLTLVLDHGRVTFSGILHYVDKAGNEQNQNGTWVKHSFSIRGFKAGSSKLTPTMIKQLRSKTEYSNALTVTCTGETNGPSVLAKDPALATARARAACGVIAKQLGIKSVKIGYKNSAAKSSVYRRVLVTLVGPATR